MGLGVKSTVLGSQKIKIFITFSFSIFFVFLIHANKVAL